MQTDTEKQQNPNEALALVITDTNSLSVPEQEREALVAVLRPIADRIPGNVQFAETCEVTNNAEAEIAKTRRDEMIADAKLADETLTKFNGGLIGRLHKTHRAWTGILGLLFDPNTAGAKAIKQKLIAFDQEQENRRLAKERELAAQAEAEAEAERERLRKREEKLKTPALKEAAAEQRASVQAFVPSVAPVKKFAAGKKLWRVKELDKAKFLAAAATNPMLQGFITVDEMALAKSKTANEMFAVEGVEFYQKIV